MLPVMKLNHCFVLVCFARPRVAILNRVKNKNTCRKVLVKYWQLEINTGVKVLIFVYSELLFSPLCNNELHFVTQYQCLWNEIFMLKVPRRNKLGCTEESGADYPFLCSAKITSEGCLLQSPEFWEALGDPQVLME